MWDKDLAGIQAMVAGAGWMALPLFLLSALLCYTIMYRYLALASGNGSSRFPGMNYDLRTHVVERMNEIRSRQNPGKQYAIELLHAEIEHELGQYRQVIRTLVFLAPLVGLLGTVSGMIDTFDALADMNLFSQDGGIADGISKALITTQIGLTIAIPGIFGDRFLARREEKLRNEAKSIIELMQ